MKEREGADGSFTAGCSMMDGPALRVHSNMQNIGVKLRDTKGNGRRVEVDF